MTSSSAPGEGWLVLFRLGFAAAACWHLLGNASLSEPSGALAVGLGAAAVAWRPRSTLTFASLTAAIWLSIWQEAPILGNHWLLAGFIGLAGTAGAVAGAGPSGSLPAVRVTVLVFYGFAAFAKLNADFFDPDVSCATFYLSESARSLGWDLQPPAGLLGGAIVVVVAAIELAVPVLLLVRRTRRWGVLLAVVFHVMVAVDHRHQFYDFTALLVPVFVTFLPPATSNQVLDVLRRHARPPVARAGAAGLALVAGAIAAGDEHDLAFELGYASWQLAAVGVVAAVALVVWRGRGVSESEIGSMLRVPVLALPIVILGVLNGVAPYVEVKTGTAWNMYANLRTVNGDSNHFVIRATLPISDSQDGLVEVLEANGGLAVYADQGLLLPRRQLRWFLQHHDDVEARLRIDGETVAVRPGQIPEELGSHVPEAVGRLLVLRAVRPAGEPVACQDVFPPAT